jgi:hypothetical protein
MPGIDIDVVSDGPDDTGSDGNGGSNGRAPQPYLSMLAGLRLSLPDAIGARGVYHMVRQIWARLDRAPRGSQQIHQLRIFGHGVHGQVWIGSGRRYPTEDQQILGVDEDQGPMLNSSDLRRIRGMFSSDGFVTIHGCNYAQGTRGYAALHGLSSTWSVRVSASSAPQVAQQAGNQFVTRLQPPILTAADLSPGACPETPIANPFNPSPQTPIAAASR